jgi:hypothetical protein
LGTIPKFDFIVRSDDRRPHPPGNVSTDAEGRDGD